MNEGGVFICYSREDTEAKEHVNRFMQAMLRAEEFGFTYWDDSQIAPGSKWRQKIDAALNQAQAGLLLVSTDFLASKFIQEVEVPRMLERAEVSDSDFRIFPLLVRPCPWEAFDWLRDLQLVNRTSEPLSGCSEHRKEEILTSLMWKISQHVQQVTDAGDEPEVPAEAAAAVQAAITPEGIGSNVEGAALDRKNLGYELPERAGFYKEWGTGFRVNYGIVHLIEESPRNPERRPVVGLVCILRTKQQRTWLAATDRHLYCVLDDAKTAAGDRQVQWRMPLGDARPVKVRERGAKSTGRIDVGDRVNWLYSRWLYPDAGKLQRTVEEMIATAGQS